MIDFRHTINYNDNLITFLMCTLKRFINRNRTAQYIEKKAHQMKWNEMKHNLGWWQRQTIFIRSSWTRGVSYAPVNNSSTALQRIMSNLYRFLHNLNCLYKEGARPSTFLCQPQLWTFPRQALLAVKKETFQRIRSQFKSFLCHEPAGWPWQN